MRLKVLELPNLIPARLLKRYKRFLADLELPDGRVVTAHCPNPGRMSSIIPAAQTVYLTDLSGQPNPKRKLDYRWELALVEQTLVMVNTQLANRVAARLLSDNQDLRSRLGIGPESEVIAEASLPPRPGKKRTRFDFAVKQPGGEHLYLEVKQISLRVDDPAAGIRWAAFPDAVTARGKRHLEELTRLRGEGVRTALLYIVGRDDVDRVRPAFEVDPEYSEAFQAAHKAGVEVLAARIAATRTELRFDKWLPVEAGIPSRANTT